MYRLLYPTKTQNLFTNRVTELEILTACMARLIAGDGQKIALIGTRRIGKSTILYEFIKRNISDHQVHFVYINLQRLVMEPISFSRSYLGLVTKWTLLDSADNFSQYEDMQFCLLQASRLFPEVAEYLYRFVQATQKREVSAKQIVELALGFPKLLTQLSGKPFIIIIDEFQEISLLNNYKTLPEIFGLVRDIFNTHERILYIFAGSYIRLMQNILEASDSPFFGQITPYYINYFDRDDSIQFLTKLIRQLKFDLSPGLMKYIVQLTSGQPFYLELFANALYEAKNVDAIELTATSVEKILLTQLINERSPLNFHLRYIYEDALGRARGSTILQGIVKILAGEAPLTLTEIANRMSRKPGLVQLSLGELMKVDLVLRKNNRYFISDPLLRWWLYLKFYHSEGNFSFQDDLIAEMSTNFREKFLATSLELGRTKEFELYYFILNNKGKKIGDIEIPFFRTLIKNYRLPNGDEIDLFAQDGETWVFELKWKNKMVGIKELQQLQQKIVADRYILISQKGFTSDLLELAQQSASIILWGMNDVVDLVRF